MAFVKARPIGRGRRALAARPSRTFPRQPAGFPVTVPLVPALAAALSDLGDLAEGGTGIDFIDQNLTAIRQQVDAAALAAKITAVCSIGAGLASVLLLFRTAAR